MRLLHVEQPFPVSFIDRWPSKKSHEKIHQEAFEEIIRLGLGSQLDGSLNLEPAFRKSLRIALQGGGASWRGPLKPEKAKHVVDGEFLSNYSKEKWEAVLLYIVRSRGSEQEHEIEARVFLKKSILFTNFLLSCGYSGSK
eukprot:m.121155 g.121155  ORF g.121155 m.121155 type:complete len:140 (-) comp14382_c0_seq3:1071-1490(-)